MPLVTDNVSELAEESRKLKRTLQAETLKTQEIIIKAHITTLLTGFEEQAKYSSKNGENFVLYPFIGGMSGLDINRAKLLKKAILNLSYFFVFKVEIAGETGNYYIEISW